VRDRQGKGGRTVDRWPRACASGQVPARLPVRVVALDVDGTILRPNFTVGPRTRQAVRRLVAQGILVVVATGRRLATAYGYAQEAGVGPQAAIVALDGALVVRGRREVLRRRPLDPEAARCLMAWAQELGVGYVLQGEGRTYVAPGQGPGGLLREALRRGALGSLAGVRHTLWELAPFWGRWGIGGHQPPEPVYKFSPIGPSAARARLRQRIEESQLAVHLTTPGGPGFEVVAAGVSKGEGLAWLLGHLGVDPSQALAIGDSWNDVHMFLTVGHPVAMGNAHAGVKAYARWVTGSVEEEGVAQVLERLAQGRWPPQEEDPL
jgi:Cof subfamily protein (haloacid dehalogenase superfamily)